MIFLGESDTDASVASRPFRHLPLLTSSWQGCGVICPEAQPPRQHWFVHEAGGLDQDPSFHRAAAQVKDVGVRLGQRDVSLGRIQAHDQLALVHATTHVAIEQKREASEHPFLGQPLLPRKMLTDAFSKPFVETHRVHLLLGQRESLLKLGWFVVPLRIGRFHR
ncbi:MAG TPA: hypothetical protein VES94_02620 [Burkholderiales bacterium]|nr:hypothetical protein [Burkholderiales bacterium]